MIQKDIEQIIEETLMKDIGDQIRITRLSKRKLIKDVAKALNMSSRQITNYENGKYKVSVTRLYQIAKFLEVDIVKLLPESVRKSVKNNN